MSQTTQDWDSRYESGEVPWDTNLPSRELLRVLGEAKIGPCRAFELGCGTGTNAIELARRGFSVLAADCSCVALERARAKADTSNVTVDFIEADLCQLEIELPPVEFLFDRGCFHCARKANLTGFLETLQRLTRPGTRYLSLMGNANEQSDEGPPRLQESEIRAALGDLFHFDHIREFRFEDPGGVEGPLGWSVLMTRC